MKSRKKIEALKQSSGEWITDPDRVENMVQDFYKDLFRDESQTFQARDAHIGT